MVQVRLEDDWRVIQVSDNAGVPWPRMTTASRWRAAPRYIPFIIVNQIVLFSAFSPLFPLRDAPSKKHRRAAQVDIDTHSSSSDVYLALKQLLKSSHKQSHIGE